MTPPSRRYRRPGVRRVALHGCCVGLVLWAGGVTSVQAQETYTQSDFGGVGLMQSPTARMAQEGEFSFTVNRATPYTNYNVSMQPLPWLEGSFRYTNVSNRLYGARSLSGNQSYKDKSIDVKVRLWQESRWLPDVSVGARDIGGTGLFSSEFIAASKRAGPVDFTLGLAWGYIGNRGDIANPLDLISSKFKTRPASGTGATGGLSINKFLRGRPGFFGGMEYHSPWQWLILKAELDGNDYKNQPQNNNQPQRWPINLGAVFRINKNVDLTLGYERGKVATAGLNLHSNLATHINPPKAFDPNPESVDFTSSPALVPRERSTYVPPSADAPDGATGWASAPGSAGNTAGGPLPAAAEGPVADAASASASVPNVPGNVPDNRKAPEQVDWAEVSKTLRDNAGISVSSIGRRGSELVIHGQQDTFFYTAEGVGRATRIIDNRVDGSIDWLTVSSERNGMATVDTSVHRPRFLELLDNRIDLPTFRRSVEQDPVTAQEEDILYRAPLKRFTGGFGLGYQQNLGGPDAFVLYQVYASASGTFNFSRNLWLDGTLNYNLVNNYNKFHYDAPSNLPRVRTNIRQYLTSSDLTMPNFQLTGTKKLGEDLYGMAYAGMLETMYGGAGGEVLYRPFGEHWAVGGDINWVKARSFDQDFSFRRYHVVTGQATGYLDTGYHNVTIAVSVGRYLAGDWGSTVDVSREFANGTRMGAYATITNKSGNSGYGEGSFDKGIYVSIPFDLLLPHSSRSRATLNWEPLMRDGGARLNKTYTLYTLTNDLDSNTFDKNLGKISD